MQCKHCHHELDATPAPGGHRRREYCDDGCRVAAYRARQEEQRRAEEAAARAAQIAREIEALRQRYPALSLGSLYLLRDLRSKYGPDLVEQVGSAMTSEIDQARHYEEQEIMQTGQELGFTTGAMVALCHRLQVGRSRSA